MDETRFTTLPSMLGHLLVTDHGHGVSGLYFPEHRRGPRPQPSWIEDPARFRTLADQLEGYLRGERTTFEVALDLRGTSFQRKVWDGLLTIGYGRTVTYGQLAGQLGSPGGSRAVASAVARNPISILVPCHRVVGADGRLTGYAGGVERKRELLGLEQAISPADPAATPR